MDNESTKSVISSIIRIGKMVSYHMPVVIFKKNSMAADKPVLAVNILPVSFISSPTNQKRKGNIYVDWYTEIFMAVIATVGVPVEEILLDIVMNSRRAVIPL